jgi:hypothetical protein
MYSRVPPRGNHVRFDWVIPTRSCQPSGIASQFGLPIDIQGTVNETARFSVRPTVASV